MTRKRQRSFATLLMALTMLPNMAGIAHANHSGAGTVIGGFEIDGDLVYPNAGLSGSTKDWSNTTPVSTFPDLFDSQSDDVFSGGDKEDEPAKWDFQNGPKPPGKDDLTKTYFSSGTSATNAYIWMAFERLAVSGDGDVHVDFELNKKGTTIVNDVGETIPERSTGDLLVAFDYSGGTGPVSVTPLTWVGNGLTGVFVPATPTPNAVAGDINLGTVTRPAAFGGGSIEEKRFGEVGLDLGALFGQAFLAASCPGFTTYSVKSRASGESTSAQLKDLVGPSPVTLSTCSTLTVQKVDDKNQPLDGATFQLYKDNGDGTFSATTDTLAGTCVTGEEGVTGQCTFEQLNMGNYFVRESAAPPGYEKDPDVVGPITLGLSQHLTVPGPFVDPLILGSIEIAKEDELGNTVPGVRFILYSDADEDEQYDAGEQAVDRAGTPAECTTGSDGTCTIDDLVPGGYRLHEDPATIPDTQTPAPDQAVVVEGDEVTEVLFVNPVKDSAISLDKTGPTKAHRGDTIAYTFTVSIPASGELPLSSVGVTDPRCAATPAYTSGDTDDDGLLDLTESWTFTCDHVVAEDDPDPLPNTATASGTDALDRTRTAQASWSVDILEPAIAIDKTGPAVAHVGDTVTYTLTVTNEGDATLSDVTVSDPKCDGDPAYVSGDANDDDKLQTSETWTYTCDHEVTEGDATDGDGTALTNTASTSGKSIISGGSTRTVNDSDGHTLTILVPGINVVKSGATQAHVGDPVTYTFAVTNIGNTPLSDVSVSDDTCSPVTYVSGDTNEDDKLQVTEVWEFECTRAVAEDDPSTVHNVATATGDSVIPGGSTQQVSDTDDHDLTVQRPGIQIVKDGPTLAHVGDEVTYSLAVTNTGTDPLDNVEVTDPKCGANPAFLSGDTDDDGLLDLTETWAYECSHTVTAGEATDGDGTALTNTATTEGDSVIPEGSTVHVSDTDTHTLNILLPEIAVVKTGVGQAHVGDEVVYGFSVSNPGNAPLSNVFISDDECSPVTRTGGDLNDDDVLQVTETWTYECARTITEADATDGDGDVLKNTATVTGDSVIPGGSTKEVSDSDDHELTIRLPDIHIVKTGPDLTHVGATVTYTLTVTNTGTVPLQNVVVDDPRCDADPTLTGGDTDDDGRLDLDETWTYTCDHLVTAAEAADGDGTNLNNTATATGDSVIPGGSTLTVSDEDSHDLRILLPAVQIVKTGPALAHVGDTVTYDLAVTNEGDTPLTDITVTDPRCDADPAFTGGDTDADGKLDLDETWTYTCSHTVVEADATDGDGTALDNTATVEGTSTAGGSTQKVSDTDDHTLTILLPAIAVVKSASVTQAHVGDIVTYTFTVTNAGDTPLTNVDVSDDLCAPVDFVSGDANEDGALQVGETWIFTCDRVVQADDPSPLPNTATAEGDSVIPEGSTQHVTSQGSDSVQLLHPGIEILKGGPASAHVGDTISYGLSVTNDGDTPLADVTVTDPVCDTDPVFTGGDTNGDGKLDLAETWTYTCDHLVTAEDADPLPNVATAAGTDSLGETVTDTDDHSVDILHPAIAIEKTAPASAHVGNTVTYSLSVTNEGDTPLSGVIVSDPRCDADPVFTGGDTDADEKLDLDETWTYTCDHVVTAEDADPLLNTATATGTDPLGQVVNDLDSASVDILHPAIHIEKTGPTQAHVGDTVTYSLAVTTEGDAPLSGVSVTDPRCDADPVFTGGDTDVDGLLEAGETWTYTCDHVVTAEDADPMPNTATASGTDDLGATVTDTDDHSVDILHPAIAIEKTGETQAHVGDTVTYDLTITNGGDTPLSDVTVSDPRCDSDPVFAGGDIDADEKLDVSETWTFTCDHVVTAEDADPLPNTATASGTDDLDQTVSSTDDHLVDILNPGIHIEKTGPTQAHVGDTVTYSLAVTNEGDTPLSDVSVSDPRCDTDPVFTGGDTDDDGKLDLGETWTYTCDHVVTAEDTDPLPNTATATGTDDLGETVSDTDDHLVDVLHPAIVIEKTGETQAHVGDTVTYDLAVTNDGDANLSEVSVSDPLCDADPIFVSGDDGDGVLEPDETWNYACDHVVTAEDVDPLPNTATASGTDDLDQTVSDTDDHLVDVLHPAIQIVKTGPTQVHRGDTITYTFEVSTDGDTPLADVSVTDPLCDAAPAFGSGDTDDDGLLDPGETWSYTCDHLVTTDDVDPLPNTATASGTDDLGATVTDTDDHLVDILDPAILIVKTGPERAHVGDTVTYTLTVTNEGDTPLAAVVVTDPMCDDLPVFTGGDDADGLLELEETWTYTCDHVVTAEDIDPLPNTATVVGVDPLQAPVTSLSSWSVDVLHPAIEIVKTVDTASGEPGDEVTYTYVVTNTGDTTLFDISVDDDKLGHIGDIAELEPGESVTLTKTTTLPRIDGDLVNIATATGTDVDGVEVSDTDDALVRVTLVLGERVPNPKTVTKPGVLGKTGAGVLPIASTGFLLLIAGFTMIPPRRRRR